MNRITALAIGLVLGAALGWVTGYVYPKRTALRRLERYVAKVEREKEPYSTTAAIYSIKGVQLIAAGMTNEAIKILSHPIADYYETYAANPGTNRYRSRMREVIDELARTSESVRTSLARKPHDDTVPVWIEGMEGYVWVGFHTNWKSKGEPDAAANGSQPFSSDTNSKSSAAGSRR
jgi:hypothetical protein